MCFLLLWGDFTILSIRAQYQSRKTLADWLNILDGQTPRGRSEPAAAASERGGSMGARPASLRADRLASPAGHPHLRRLEPAPGSVRRRGAELGHVLGPAVQPDQRLVVDDVGVVGGAVAGDVEALAEIRLGVLVDRRTAHDLPCRTAGSRCCTCRS